MAKGEDRILFFPPPLSLYMSILTLQQQKTILNLCRRRNHSKEMSEEEAVSHFGILLLQTEASVVELQYRIARLVLS